MEARESFTSQLIINANSVNDIIPLPMPASFTMPTGATKISELLELTNFKARASIKSIGEAVLPNYTLEDSETDRLRKSLNIEWNSPRVQLNLYVGTANNWALVSSLSLLNPSGYPYRIYDLLAMYAAKDRAYIGNNVNLGIEIEDVGYGKLRGNDRVDIYADIIRTISYFASDIVTVNQGDLINNINVPTSGNTGGNTGNNGNNGDGDNNNNPPPNTGDDEEMPLMIASYTQVTNAVNRDRILISYVDNGLDPVAEIYLPASPTVGTEIEILSGGCKGKVWLQGNKTYRGQSIDWLGVGYGNGVRMYPGCKLVYGYTNYTNDGTWFPVLPVSDSGAGNSFGVQNWD